MTSQLEQNDKHPKKRQIPFHRKGPSLLSICWTIFIIFLIFLGIWLKIVVPPPKSNVRNVHVDWTTLGVHEKIPDNIEEENKASIKSKKASLPSKGIKKPSFLIEPKKASNLDEETSIGLNEKLPAVTPQELEALKEDTQQAQILLAEAAITLSQPGVCIILSGVGLKEEYERQIVERLVPEINLAVLPFKPAVVDSIKEWIKGAREFIAEIPMESLSYPDKDDGKNTLLTGLSSEENIARLEKFLAYTPGVKGIINLDGTRFTAVRKDLMPIIQYLQRKKLLFVDSVTTPRSQVDEVSAILKSPFLAVTLTIPIETDSDVAWKMLKEEAEKSLKHGLSIVKIDISPKRLNDLIEWQDKLKQVGMKLYKLSETYSLHKNKDENRALSPAPQNGALEKGASLPQNSSSIKALSTSEDKKK